MTRPIQPTAKPTRAVLAVTLGAVSLAALAGCAPAAPADVPAPAAPATPLKDGTYTETGDYSSPGGPESLTVTLTTKAGAVTAVTVKGTGHTPNARQYQQAFASGVDAVVVGKPLSTLKVGAVSGSSLTPAGFNAALDKIRSDAR